MTPEQMQAIRDAEFWRDEQEEIRVAINRLDRSLFDKRGTTAEFARRILNGMRNTLTQINWTDLRQIAEDNPS